MNGEKITQSKAILRYLGRKFDMFGDGDDEMTKVDEMMEHIKDLEQEFFKTFTEKDETKKEAIRNNIKTNVLPAFVTLMSGVLKKNKTGYLVGKKLSIADIHLFAIFDNITKMDGFNDVLENNADLTAHSNMIKSIPNIKAWLDKRPNTPF